MVNTINTSHYLSEARNMYREEIEARHKNALIECFTEDFS